MWKFAAILLLTAFCVTAEEEVPKKGEIFMSYSCCQIFVSNQKLKNENLSVIISFALTSLFYLLASAQVKHTSVRGKN